MDGRGKHILKGIWPLFLAGIIFFLIAFLLLGKSTTISQKQIEEITALHPETAQDIEETFIYYDKQRTRVLLYLGGAGVVLFGTALFACLLQHARMQQKERLTTQNNLQTLLKQLELFQKGEYEIKNDLFPVEEPIQDTISWKDIQNQLQELGYFLASCQERLATEENNTKTLITDISHQLKTPFSSLKMCYELSHEPSLSAKEREEFIEKEKQEICTLENLLEELVKLSKLESNMIQIKRTSIPLSLIITDAVNRIIMKAHAKNICLETNLPEELIVSLDRKWSAEAIVNILDNAIKYSPEDTKINLRVSKLPTLILIEIEDEGIGIPAEELHRIFQRFYRGREGSRFTGEGAGVGLYLARKIIEEQNGTVTAKRKQRGTIFRITFPLAK